MSTEATQTAQATTEAVKEANAPVTTEAVDASQKSPEAQEAVTETKTTEEAEAKPEESKVEKYELKLPEGAHLKEEAIQRIEALAKEKGLDQEAAQLLLERENAAISEYVADQNAQYEERQKAWVDEIKNDKELGGEQFEATVHLSKRVVQRFASEAFKESLEKTGLGNNPELVRVFARIGKAIGEDKLASPGAAGGAPRSFADRLYGSNNN